MEAPSAQLGLGLVAIGRAWGRDMAAPPPESEARALLEAAFELGVKVFDTAPAYGASERILGAFLRSLTEDQRRTVFIATKFGEHWDEDRRATYVDHSYDALMRSLDHSVELLRDIDLLQVHKASVGVLEGGDLKWALEGAQAMDIPQIGASISDLEAGRRAVQMGFHWLQMPYNAINRALEPLFAEAEAGDVRLISNRPLATGALIGDAAPEARKDAIRNAFAAVLKANRQGVVLTGARSAAQLRESQRIFSGLVEG